MADWQRNDRELLARILTAEAGNQGPVGMTAAGNVIMNRASTGGYGDGVRGVIMKPGQFSPMNSVTGYAGGEQGQNIDAISPSETAYMVADSLLSGTAGDITKGATHFYNPEISNPSWAQGVEFTRIGDHVFGRADAPRGARSAANTTQRSQPMAVMTQQPQQQEPRGILEMMGIQRRDPNAEGQTALPFYQRDKFADLMSGLAVGANALSQRPDENFAAQVQAGQQRRQSEQRANRTVEWLRTQPNSEAFVQMLESGASPAAVLQAYQAAQSSAAAAARGEIREVDGRLVRVMPDGNVSELYAPESAALSPEMASQAGALRDDLNRDLGGFNTVKSSYENIMQFYNNPNAVSDYALAVAFAKVLDPGSVAREGEVAAVQNAGARIPALGQALRNAITGEGQLTSEVRQQIAENAAAIYQQQATGAQGTLARYEEAASRYNIPFDLVYFGGDIPAAQPIASAAPPPPPAGVSPDDWATAWANMSNEERLKFTAGGN